MQLMTVSLAGVTLWRAGEQLDGEEERRRLDLALRKFEEEKRGEGGG
jgi:hypothetical protein